MLFSQIYLLEVDLAQNGFIADNQARWGPLVAQWRFFVDVHL